MLAYKRLNLLGSSHGNTLLLCQGQKWAQRHPPPRRKSGLAFQGPSVTPSSGWLRKSLGLVAAAPDPISHFAVESNNFQRKRERKKVLAKKGPGLAAAQVLARLPEGSDPDSGQAEAGPQQPGGPSSRGPWHLGLEQLRSDSWLRDQLGSVQQPPEPPVK